MNRSWTGFAGLPYTPLSNTALVNDLLPKSCSDKRLSAQDREFCKRCCSLKTRKACLGTTGRSWNDGAGELSCYQQSVPLLELKCLALTDSTVEHSACLRSVCVVAPQAGLPCG